MSSTGEYSGSCVCVRRYQDGFRCTRGYQHHPTQQCKCIFIIIIIIINMCKYVKCHKPGYKVIRVMMLRL